MFGFNKPPQKTPEKIEADRKNIEERLEGMKEWANTPSSTPETPQIPENKQEKIILPPEEQEGENIHINDQRKFNELYKKYKGMENKIGFADKRREIDGRTELGKYLDMEELGARYKDLGEE
jgi:hypothetical protein